MQATLQYLGLLQHRAGLVDIFYHILIYFVQIGEVYNLDG